MGEGRRFSSVYIRLPRGRGGRARAYIYASRAQSVKAINLVAIVKHEDITENGIDSFLAPFVSDLRKLYCDGITVSVGGQNYMFYGGLIAFLANNLAAHLLGGFKESMSFALRMCRTCYCTRNLIKTSFTEAACTLRTAESHYSQSQLLQGSLKTHYSTVYGINRLSILEDVPGFSVVHGLHHDIMHDLFEGVVPYEVKLLLHHYIQSKYFSLELTVWTAMISIIISPL